jgi:nucleoside-diphosphate-sugar epimerase
VPDLPAVAVLITGATGFVGSHVAEAFAERGDRVRALVRSTSRTTHLEALGVEIVVAPLEDAAALAGAVADADVVVHLAALTRASGEAEFDRANRDGTANLVRALLGAEPRPRRLVYLSSLAAAGPALDGTPAGRDDAPRPLTAYGRSKLAGEAECAAAADAMEVVIVRAPAVYGPRDRDLYHFFRLAKLGVLPVPSGPTRSLQLVHVADLADGIVAAATAPNARGVYYVAEPRAYAWAEVCGLVADAVGRPGARRVPLPAALVSAAAAGTEAVGRLVGRPVIFDRDKAREMLADGWLCETDSARAELGFETRIPLAEGLAETARWYRAEGLL